ncbi:hypothetical protein ACFVHQ_03135 [Actinomycetes bacterium NPDC127524]
MLTDENVYYTQQQDYPYYSFTVFRDEAFYMKFKSKHIWVGILFIVWIAGCIIPILTAANYHEFGKKEETSFIWLITGFFVIPFFYMYTLNQKYTSIVITSLVVIAFLLGVYILFYGFQRFFFNI